KRLHTFAEFREKVDWLRRLVPGISMTTDIIAGFPGEREEDHEATARALEEIRFDGAYIYKYSVRPGTPASKFTDDVPLPLKERRNAGLLDIQRRISREISKPFVGQALEVFVEGFSTKGSARLVGRSHAEKRVLFPGEAALIGSFQRVKIEQLVHDTFVGSLEER
ncbi:MAG: tRNA (N6-isopentenyl adenosine(37)-C2)-methylthiotransferase MiaB, partial [Candidatus Omnitrophota bacterium]